MSNRKYKRGQSNVSNKVSSVQANPMKKKDIEFALFNKIHKSMVERRNGSNNTTYERIEDYDSNHA